jgi:CTP synthase (UTP-ammonia lyase)
VTVRVALLGDRNPEGVTHKALDALIEQLPSSVVATWVPTDLEAARDLSNFDGVWVVPGTPYRNDDAVYSAIEWARTAGTPILGTCGGFQYMLVEFARNVAGIRGAGHAETDPDAEDAIVGALACSLIGEKREVRCVPGTKLGEICGLDPFTGFHWCNYGLRDDYVERLERAGLVVSAHASDAGVEAVELPGHPFYVATLFQPQMGALQGEVMHPLIAAFLQASAKTRV